MIMHGQVEAPIVQPRLWMMLAYWSILKILQTYRKPRHQRRLIHQHRQALQMKIVAFVVVGGPKGKSSKGVQQEHRT
jgi:hypothetical protein